MKTRLDKKEVSQIVVRFRQKGYSLPEIKKLQEEGAQPSLNIFKGLKYFRNIIIYGKSSKAGAKPWQSMNGLRQAMRQKNHSLFKQERKNADSILSLLGGGHEGGAEFNQC